MSRRRQVLGLLVAGVFALLSWQLRRPIDWVEPARPITSLSLQIGAWQGVDRKLSERQYALLETREVLLRDWRRSPEDAPVVTCIAVAGGNRKAAHPPHVCYRGQGWSIRGREDVQRRTLGGRERIYQELRIQKGERRQLVWSWYRIGPRETASYLQQQWLGMLAQWKGRAPDSALMRFSTPMLPGGETAARQRLQGFLDEVLPTMEEAFGQRHDPLAPRQENAEQ